ncbi:MAG: adenosylcobinamide-GDP ribazoletransferase [Syntrophobacterales bacterium]|jgi:adenosylcobinamide-GDP ribazoletransferase
MLRGLVTAFRTLTIFPVPGRDTSIHSNSLPFFPLVGLALGFLLWAISLINTLIDGNGGWPMGIAAIMLLVSVISTRSLHLDGLADFVDAAGGGWDKSRRLEIMKDTRLGVFGAVAIILTLLCKWLAFARLVTTGSTIWLILIHMLSRTMQVNLAARLPYARSEGGTALPFVQDASGYHRWAALAIVLFAALIYGPLGLVALAVAQIITWVYGSWCRKNMGGITGDLLGAGNEIIEVTLLLLAAILGSQLDTHIGWGWWLE